jgi:hypothetical protein
MLRWKEAAKLETEATWLEVCRIDSPFERLAAAGRGSHLEKVIRLPFFQSNPSH